VVGNEETGKGVGGLERGAEREVEGSGYCGDLKGGVRGLRRGGKGGKRVRFMDGMESEGKAQVKAEYKEELGS
jgi:hypothetical protein